MQSAREDWLRWAATLRRYRAEGFVSWLLDAGAPLALVAAQVLYWGQPLLGDTAGALGHLLESDEDAGAFAALLRGGPLP